MELSEFQQKFSELIHKTQWEKQDGEVLAQMFGNPGSQIEQGLSSYRYTFYLTRFEILSGVYPYLQSFLGKESFHNLCKEFILIKGAEVPGIQRYYEPFFQFAYTQLKEHAREILEFEKIWEDLNFCPPSNGLETDQCIAALEEFEDKSRVQVSSSLIPFSSSYPLQIFWSDYTEVKEGPYYFLLYYTEQKRHCMEVPLPFYQGVKALKTGQTIAELSTQFVTESAQKALNEALSFLVSNKLVYSISDKKSGR